MPLPANVTPDEKLGYAIFEAPPDIELARQAIKQGATGFEVEEDGFSSNLYGMAKEHAPQIAKMMEEAGLPAVKTAEIPEELREKLMKRETPAAQEQQTPAAPQEAKTGPFVLQSKFGTIQIGSIGGGAAGSSEPQKPAAAKPDQGGMSMFSNNFTSPPKEVRIVERAETVTISGGKVNVSKPKPFRP